MTRTFPTLPEYDRRRFLGATGSAFAAMLAGCAVRDAGALAAADIEPLVPDPAGLLDLPPGYSYRIISRLGDKMNDGGMVPDKGDGMGCFALPGGQIALVRNHELRPGDDAGALLTSGFGRGPDGAILPGGTTTIVLDSQTLAVERQFRSLAGTWMNCAGGVTPWGSWLSCEESAIQGTKLPDGHGYVFEVPADTTGLVDPVPLRAMGRFNHEATCTDPASGIVYMTEDRNRGLLYRFIPNVRGRLAQGGRLEALSLVDGPGDSRNWDGSELAPGSWSRVRWIPLEDVESPSDDLRLRGAAKGATIFARGEGIHMGEGELYFTATSGGAERIGQVFRLHIDALGGDRLQLFYESASRGEYFYGDNLVIAPNGHLIVCEDKFGPNNNYVRGIRPNGRPYPLARLRVATELAGACFSPDGSVMFVNAYSPTITLAISGPWLSAGTDRDQAGSCA